MTFVLQDIRSAIAQSGSHYGIQILTTFSRSTSSERVLDILYILYALFLYFNCFVLVTCIALININFCISVDDFLFIVRILLM